MLSFNELDAQAARLRSAIDYVMHLLATALGGKCESLQEGVCQLVTDRDVLRKAFEEQDCGCKQRSVRCCGSCTSPRWEGDPCPRCLMVVTWGGEVSEHPGLKRESTGPAL